MVTDVDPAAPPWHACEPREVAEHLDVDPDAGLDRSDVASRREQHGPNRLARSEATPWWQTLLDQFRDPLIYILMIAGALTIALTEFIDAAFIAGVLVLNAAIGYYQERRAELSVQSLMELVSPAADVVRDGRRSEIDAEDLVPGDVVHLESGGKVPADVRLVEARSLRIDESLLTGESVAVDKHIEPVDPDAPLADRDSMAFSGAVVAGGRGRGIVVATGTSSELGRIAEQMRAAETVTTPLQQRMGRFANIIGVVIAVSAALTFLVGLALGFGAGEMVRVAAALAVAAIPEGLPVVLTVALARGVRRMARRHAIVRNLPAVETLGSTSLIGADKTGTLTENRMTVEEVWAGGESHHRPDPDGDDRPDDADDVPGPDARPVTLARLAAALANEARLGGGDGEGADGDGNGEGPEGGGDPTEVALLVDAARHHDLDRCRQAWEEEAAIPFESDHRYAASFRRRDGRHFVFVKGAPERVLEMVADFAGGDSAPDAERVREQAGEMAREGLRVLATAYAELPGAPDGADPPEPGGLTFLGLHGLLDPPRDGVADSVAACRSAGQRVVMITGDHADTARAIARQVGIVDDEDAPSLTGHEVDDLDDAELRDRLGDTAVFARVSPDHKLRIVQAAQELGHVVAVTGDGVNDGPALQAADIGVAMGEGGTDVAREASDMVLADDNFVTIEAAVAEGRITFDNVRKVTFFLVSTGVGTFLVVPISIFAGWPLILVPAQLLWANLVTKGLQDLSLAFEPGEPDILERPPRARGEPVVTGALWVRTAITGAVIAAGTLYLYAWARDQEGFTLEQERTVALSALVVFQAFHLFSSRSELRSVFAMSPFSNRFLFVAQVGALAVHVGALHLGATQFVLRVEPIPLDAWWRIVAVALSVLVAVEIDKAIRRRSPIGRRASGSPA